MIIFCRGFIVLNEVTHLMYKSDLIWSYFIVKLILNIVKYR